jgi:hypothetical protein
MVFAPLRIYVRSERLTGSVSVTIAHLSMGSPDDLFEPVGVDEATARSNHQPQEQPLLLLCSRFVNSYHSAMLSILAAQTTGETISFPARIILNHDNAAGSPLHHGT